MKLQRSVTTRLWFHTSYVAESGFDSEQVQIKHRRVVLSSICCNLNYLPINSQPHILAHTYTQHTLSLSLSLSLSLTHTHTDAHIQTQTQTHTPHTEA